MARYEEGGPVGRGGVQGKANSRASRAEAYRLENGTRRESAVGVVARDSNRGRGTNLIGADEQGRATNSPVGCFWESKQRSAARRSVEAERRKRDGDGEIKHEDVQVSHVGLLEGRAEGGGVGGQREGNETNRCENRG